LPLRSVRVKSGAGLLISARGDWFSAANTGVVPSRPCMGSVTMADAVSSRAARMKG